VNKNNLINHATSDHVTGNKKKKLSPPLVLDLVVVLPLLRLECQYAIQFL